MKNFDLLKKISFFKKKSIQETDPNEENKKNKLKEFVNKYFGTKLGKLSVSTEEIVGLDISKDAIRVVQVNKNKEDNWVLEKFSLRSLDSFKI